MYGFHYGLQITFMILKWVRTDIKSETQHKSFSWFSLHIQMRKRYLQFDHLLFQGDDAIHSNNEH